MPKMWEIWECTPLEFIMRNRFPYEDPELAKMPGLDPSRQTVLPEDYAAQAAEYRKALNTISERELYVLAEEVEREITEELGQTESRRIEAMREAEEASQFYNQPEADADFEAWARTPIWSITEAVALSFGKDPDIVNWETVQGIETASEFTKQFKVRSRIFRRAAMAKALSEAMSPRMFLAWAERTRLELPAALVNAIKENCVESTDWKTHHDGLLEKEQALQAEAVLLRERIVELEQKIADLQRVMDAPEKTEKPGEKRERKTLLRMIIGMAVVAYHYDPANYRSSTIPDIKHDLELAGVPVDDETIRKFIGEGRALLPPSKPN